MKCFRIINPNARFETTKTEEEIIDCIYLIEKFIN